MHIAMTVLVEVECARKVSQSMMEKAVEEAVRNALDDVFCNGFHQDVIDENEIAITPKKIMHPWITP